jgi:predicted RNA-binding Zn-ribbon protein involved in translation (DUF1610 family)
MIMTYTDEDRSRIKQRIMEFNPICIKCGNDLGQLLVVSGHLCPKCNYDIVESAVNQLELHFQGYNVPPELMRMFKTGIRENTLK